MSVALSHHSAKRTADKPVAGAPLHGSTQSGRVSPRRQEQSNSANVIAIVVIADIVALAFVFWRLSR
jgi:hypothetical protein